MLTRIRSKLLPLVLCGLVCSPIQLANAGTVRPMSLAEIIETADRVFVGKCIDVRTGRDEHGLPVTYISFSVIETIKGNTGRVVTIKTIGGGPGTLQLADMPTFREGEEVLLFLYPESRYGFTSPVGLYQGKWTVKSTPSGTKQLQPSLGGVPVYGAVPGAETRPGSGGSPGLVDYTRFISRIRRMANR